jgi:beta-phosphoglucomutase family hydrolase
MLRTLVRRGGYWQEHGGIPGREEMTDGGQQAVDLSRYDALLLDLDGVITQTATVHAAAWKDLFDDFLGRWGREHGEPFEPFDISTDYINYVDGRRRYDGVDTFLRSRGIELPYGDATDAPDAQTVCGLGNRKNRYFVEHLAEQGVEVFDDTVELIRAARSRGGKIAVVSASENCEAILRRAGLLELFDARVTGIEAAALHLAGKPAPDTFLKAAELLDTAPARAAVFEDAISGVQAGRAGGFGLVVGVDRRGEGNMLAENGADVVTDDLRQFLPPPAANAP